MAYNYNHTTLVGRLTKDPEIVEIKEERCKCILTLAINRNYKKEDGTQETDFIPICFWGKRAKVSFEILQKGMPILVWGRIQVSQYEKDNERRWKTEVVAENFQVLDKLPSSPKKNTENLIAKMTK